VDARKTGRFAPLEFCGAPALYGGARKAAFALLMDARKTGRFALLEFCGVPALNGRREKRGPLRF